MIGHQNGNDPSYFGKVGSVTMYAMIVSAEENSLECILGAEVRDVSDERRESGVRWKGWS